MNAGQKLLQTSRPVYLAAFLIPLQIIAGDLHDLHDLHDLQGLNTMEHQPAKLAAMEGIWKTQKGVLAELFALSDEKTRTNKYEISIPKLASLYLTHDLDGEVKGLNEFVGKHPPVTSVFWAFHIMVGVGLLMLLIRWASVFQLKFLRKAKKRESTVWLARILVGMTFVG